ncbi:Gldg family protein [Candidatus Palauibacter sp.]|uniref:Gldg family protein n=1 Tax=Candidatus Palauibacter sp. TaxID=3101350 RepID=UPI003B51BB71
MIGRILTVAKREFASYFDHATAYILLVIFLGINFYFYFQEAYLLGEASLRPMLSLLPWLLLFFIPAVCMRSFAEERNAGTLELVLAQPIQVVEFLLGKFVGVLLFMSVAMAGTLGIPLGLTLGADLQWGVVFSQYLGSMFLMSALAAVGLWASSLTRNQVTAFIIGVTVGFALYLIGLPTVTLSLAGPLAAVAARLGVLGHFSNVARGVIDLRDVLYFAALATAFLSLTYFSVMRERLSREGPAYRRLRVGVLGMVGIAIFAALAGAQLRGRLDLTPGKVYTLSPPTADLLQNLDDLVTLKLFQSAELPPQLTPVSRDLDDLLRDLDATGGANVNLVRADPDEDPDAQQEAGLLGIRPVPFQIVDDDELSIQERYFGLAVQYAGESQVIPLVRQTADLEYRLASMIRALTRAERPAIGILTGHGELSLNAGLRLARGRLQLEYDVVEFGIDSTTAAVPDSIDVLVIAGGRMPLEPAAGQIISRFVDGGGSLFVLKSGVTADMQARYAGPTFDPALDSLLQARGLGIVPSLAFDLLLHEQVEMPSQGGSYIVPYPLWTLTQPASGHVIVDGVTNVPIRFGSPLLVEVEDSTLVTPLLTTSEGGGRLQTPLSIDAMQDWAAIIAPDGEISEEDVTTETLAVAYTQPGGGRIVLAGSSSLIHDETLSQSMSGLAGMIFFQNAIDWLAQDEALISIRSKDRAPPTLLFPNEWLPDLTRYGNLAGVPLLFVLIGVLRLARRRKVQQRSFTEGGALV